MRVLGGVAISFDRITLLPAKFVSIYLFLKGFISERTECEASVGDIMFGGIENRYKDSCLLCGSRDEGLS
jgi:hypothetical protein